MPKKVSQSGFGPVIVCHFALSSIWGLPKHPRITTHHQIFRESHRILGDVHPNFIGISSIFGDVECFIAHWRSGPEASGPGGRGLKRVVPMYELCNIE